MKDFLEDYYYLKEVIDVMNITLKNHGYENVNDLDMEHNYIWMNKLLQSDMQKRANQLNNSEVFKMPFKSANTRGSI